MDKTLLNLPWQIQVVLASGYAAYLLAYRGIRDGHKPLDATFISLSFSVIASGVLYALSRSTPLLAGAAAFTVTCALAILWRRFFRNLLHALLRFADITWADDTPSAWAKFLENSADRLSQIAVELDDYTWLECDEPANFEDAPFGPAYLGTNGDIAFYVTHVRKKGEDPKSQATIRDPDWGDRITYVPASRIRRVTMRFKKLVNPRLLAAQHSSIEPAHSSVEHHL